MWLSNVVIIITFIFLILQIIPKIKKQNRIFIYALIDIAVAFEILFIWHSVKNISLSHFLQVLILIFAYIIPMGIVALNNTNISFRLKILYAIAKFAYTFKRYEFCAGILFGAIKNDKQNVKYYTLRSKALEKLGEISEARNMLFEVIQIDKNNKEAYIDLVNLLEKEDKKDTALVMLAQLLRIDPNYTKAKEMMGIIYSELNRDNEAQSIYEELVQNDEATADTYYNLGIIYSKQNDLDKAEQAYIKAIEKNPKLFETYYALGKLCYVKEELDKSIEFLKISKKDELFTGKADFAISMCYIKKEELDKAAEYLEKAVKQDKQYILRARQNKIFDQISLEVSRLEDENRNLEVVTYETEE